MARPAVRIQVVQFGVLVSLALLVGRAAQVQILHGRRWAEEAQAQRTERIVLQARRGTLYDRHGTPLAVTQETYHVGIAPNELRDPTADGALISRRLGLTARAWQLALRRRYAYFAGPYSALEVQPLRSVRGVHLEPVLNRFYPDPAVARATIGRLGDDGLGASGLERTLDSLLAGRAGAAVVLKDRAGREYESPARVIAPPVPGLDVVLTLDAELQEIAQRALDDALRRMDADGGDVVMLDPGTGEVLALASRQRDGSARPSAFTDTFEPGSLAKIFAAAALLSLRRVSPTDHVSGEGGKWRVPGRTITDDDPQPSLTLADAIRVSSNIAIAKFAARLTPEEQYAMLRDFGFGALTGIEFPAEATGRLRPPSEWTRPSAASLAMGYELSVTPIQVAMAYGALANDGLLLQPTLIREVRDASGGVRYRHRPEPVRRVVARDVAAALRNLLRGVVERGTGTEAALTNFPVAAKTGTARPRRGGLRHAGGRAHAPPARVPRGAPGLGCRGAHLAGGGRQRGRRLDGHVVRRPVRRRPGPLPWPDSSAPRAAVMNKLQEVVAALERAQLLVELPDLHTWPEITGLTADSRKVERGMLYCAVYGSVRDGHEFVMAARERGAAAALVEREQAVDVPQILVRDGRRAAAVAAEAWYDRPGAKLDLIGVTGTNGKTTSVTLLRHVLSALEPTGSIGTLGAFDPAGDPVPSEAGNLTTPGPIDLQATLAALVERGARGAAMEVSSHSLDQGRVDGLVFRAALFTNLTRDHLDYHKTLEDYFRAKAKLVQYLAPDGLEVVNADDPARLRLRREHRRVTFGERGGDVTAARVTLDAAGADFELVTPMGGAEVRLPLLGRFNVANALGVAACAWGLGVPVETIAERLTRAPQVPGRMERIAERPCTVLRDYAHTPDALERALETLRPRTKERLIGVFGAGGDRDRGKRAPMGTVAVRLADSAIVTSDNPRTEDPEKILDDVEVGMRAKPHTREVDRRRAIARALELARPGDTNLLAGEGHETHQVD